MLKQSKSVQDRLLNPDRMLSPKHPVKKKCAFAEVRSEDGKRESAIPEPVATFLGRGKAGDPYITRESLSASKKDLSPECLP